MMLSSLHAIAAQATGLPAGDIELTPRAPLEHQANRLYDFWAAGRHLILKEFLLPDERHAAAAREYQALKLLAPLDLAPQPVFFDPSLGPVVIYEFMAGEMWDRRKPTTADLAQLAGAWLQMHAATPAQPWLAHNADQPLERICARLQTHLQAYADWVAAEFPAGRAAANACLGLLASRRDALDELTAAKPVLCFCKADPRFANVIQRPTGRLGLIDWEDGGLLDPTRDLADVMTHPNQEDLLSLDEWPAFVQPYLAGRGALDASLARRAHLYQALFPIFWLTVIMNQGRRLASEASVASNAHLAGWSINGLPPNQRLRRYLARAQAWPALNFARELDQLNGLEFFPCREP